MIRFRRVSIGLLRNWLVEQSLNGSTARYRLRLWRESRSALAALESELKLYFDEAFQDARRRIGRLSAGSNRNGLAEERTVNASDPAC